MLSVSHRTVRRMIKRGELVAYRIGGLRVDAESVTRLLEASRFGGSRDVDAWHEERERNREKSADTFSAKTTSPDNEGSQKFGGGGSTVEKYRSVRRLERKRRKDSISLPQNSSELRQFIKQLEHRSS